MAAKRASRTKAVWRASGIAKATAAVAASETAATALRRVGADPVDVGAQAIYEMRSHPRKKHWGDLADQERAIWRERMQIIVAALGRKRYVIGR